MHFLKYLLLLLNLHLLQDVRVLQLLNTLQSQKNIAANRNKYLRAEKENIRKKIIENNLKKIKAEEKASDYKRHYISELENKSYQ